MVAYVAIPRAPTVTRNKGGIVPQKSRIAKAPAWIKASREHHLRACAVSDWLEGLSRYPDVIDGLR
jgi:hypothetical protein